MITSIVIILDPKGLGLRREEAMEVRKQAEKLKMSRNEGRINE